MTDDTSARRTEVATAETERGPGGRPAGESNRRPAGGSAGRPASGPTDRPSGPPTDGASHDGGGRSSRRGYLRGLGALGVVAASSAGLVAGPASAATPFDDRFGTVVDVTDAGADPTGGESITPVLEANEGDDTLLWFPPGEYAMDSQFRHTGFDNFGLAGEAATIVPANCHEFDGPQYRLFRLGVPYNPGRDLLVDGLTVDQTAQDTGIRAIEAMVTDGLEIRDVTVEGRHDSGTWGPGFFSVTEPGGSGVVERFAAPDGGAWVTNTPDPLDFWRGPTGVLLSRYHRGTIELRDCRLGDFPDNGLYGVTRGTVRVIGGHYENSNAASIRLAGTNCVVRGTTITVDDNPPEFPTQRGIWLEAGRGFRVEDVDVSLPAPNGNAIEVDDGVESARIEDSTVTVGDRVNHAIVVESGAGPTDVVDTDVEIHGGGNAIHVDGRDAGRVLCENVQIWGRSAGSTFRHAIRCNRNGCELRGVKVWQPGPDMRRAVVLNGDDCLIYKGEFKARHHPILVNGDSAWIEDVYADSYDGYEAIRLNTSSANATIKYNTLIDGVLDKGSDGLRMYGNEF